jgi:hypothetical protein
MIRPNSECFIYAGFCRSSKGFFHLKLFVYAASRIGEDWKLARGFCSIREDSRRVTTSEDNETGEADRRWKSREDSGGDVRWQGADIILIARAEEVAY